jgi:hypothetical protein
VFAVFAVFRTAATREPTLFSGPVDNSEKHVPPGRDGQNKHRKHRKHRKSQPDIDKERRCFGVGILPGLEGESSLPVQDGLAHPGF